MSTHLGDRSLRWLTKRQPWAARASLMLGLIGGLAQLAIAFMGDAIGGMSTVVVLLAIDAIVALVGAAVVFRWTVTGLILMAAAALGAAVALFTTTWLEIGVAALLIGAVAAASVSGRRHAAGG